MDMGVLTYGGHRMQFDDRLLVHLQVVIIQRFRRGEGFAMSWVRSVAIGSGRSTVWLSPSLPVVFDFEGSRAPSINAEWLRRLSDTASSGTGLIVTNEDGTLGQEGLLGGPKAARLATA
jgi:hypothetical protein